MDDEEIPIQDDKREDQLIKIFGLVKVEGKDRHPSGHADAQDELANSFQLKSTTKDDVSTARDFGRNHLHRFLKSYWLVGRGRNLSNGFCYDRIFFLAPVHLQPWAEKLSARFDRFDMIGLKMLNGLSPHDLYVANQMVKRGSTLNAPPLPWNYVCMHGIEIVSDHVSALRKLVFRFPMMNLTLAKPLMASHFFTFERAQCFASLAEPYATFSPSVM